MEVESAEKLLHARDEPEERLFCRKVQGPVRLRLERACSLVTWERGASHYIQGEGQCVEIPEDPSGWWIIVCEKPFTVPFGFCDLGQYATAEHPDQRRSFGLSGNMQLRFLYSSGFWSLIRKAGELEMLSAGDVLNLVRDNLFNALRGMLHELLRAELWEYNALIDIRRRLPEYLYQCFDEVFAQYGICIIRRSLRITGYALRGND